MMEHHNRIIATPTRYPATTEKEGRGKKRLDFCLHPDTMYSIYIIVDFGFILFNSTAFTQFGSKLDDDTLRTMTQHPTNDAVNRNVFQSGSFICKNKNCMKQEQKRQSCSQTFFLPQTKCGLNQIERLIIPE